MKPISALFLFLMAAHAWAAPSGFDKALEEKNWAQLSQMIEEESDTMDEDNFLTLFRVCEADHTSPDRENLLKKIVSTITKDSILQYPTVLVEIMKKDLDLLEQGHFYKALDKASDVDQLKVIYAATIAHFLKIMPKNIPENISLLRDDITNEEMTDESLEEFTTTFLSHFTKEELQQGIFDIANRAVSKNSHGYFQSILEDMMQSLIKHSLTSYQELLEEIIQKTCNTIKNDSNTHEKMVSGYVATQIFKRLNKIDLTGLNAEEKEAQAQAVQTLQETVEQAFVTAVEGDGTMVSEYVATQILETLRNQDLTVLNTEILSKAFVNATKLANDEDQLVSESVALQIMWGFFEKIAQNITKDVLSNTWANTTKVVGERMISENLALQIVSRVHQLNEPDRIDSLTTIVSVLEEAIKFNGERMVSDKLTLDILKMFPNTEEFQKQIVDTNTIPKIWTIATNMINGRMISEGLAFEIVKNFPNTIDMNTLPEIWANATKVSDGKMIAEYLALRILETFPQKLSQDSASELFQKATEVIGEEMVAEDLVVGILEKFSDKFDQNIFLETLEKALNIENGKVISECVVMGILKKFSDKCGENALLETFAKVTKIENGKMLSESLARKILADFPEKFSEDKFSQIKAMLKKSEMEK